jgi:hypothetical protein
MAIKKKYQVFNINTGKFEDSYEEPEDINDYLQILDAEKEIALRMIKQKLDKISPDDYKESTD